jgi:hypothetical protein
MTGFTSYNSFNNLEISSNLGVKIISIRLFFAFPSAVSFDINGAYSLLPAAVILALFTFGLAVKIVTMAVARFVDKSQLFSTPPPIVHDQPQTILVGIQTKQIFSKLKKI